MRKPAFCICENKEADQLRGNHEADQRLCFTTWIVQSLFCLNLKFQASSRLLWVYSLVYVRPGRKPRRPVFSQRGSYDTFQKFKPLVSAAQVVSNLVRITGGKDSWDRTQMIRVIRKPMFWLLTWSNTNQAVQLQKMAGGLKF